ncbi:hypothetical protein BT96DRAFT_1058171 [Gymnopus androsaceus JB14]|uniref:Zinc finger C3HC4 RING-type domain-containing protein n=1 Tax=Gymnopus androsaceus JB14 TaxID=1447944 RepID=A0A6A4I8H7_9AGAR|nr:hypothetical protein BT96DRAFT_1058171 [Gymnopus androsaceus JB14]
MVPDHDHPLPAPLTSRPPLPRFRAASASSRGPINAYMDRDTDYTTFAERIAPSSSFSTLSNWDDESHIRYHPFDFMMNPNSSSSSGWYDNNPANTSAHLYDDDDISMQDVSEQLLPQTQTRNSSHNMSLSHLLNDDHVEFVQSKGKGKQKAVEVEVDDDEPYLYGPKGIISSKAKGKQKAVDPPPADTTPPIPPEILAEHALSQYTCPICFCPPTNATMTLCGHVACGACLFTAVKTAMRRENIMGAGSREDGGPR